MKTVILLAAGLAIALALPARAEEPAGGSITYQEPQNLCDELGGDPECPPNGEPIDPAKVQAEKNKPAAAPQQPQAQPQETAPAGSGAQAPEPYQNLESDCDKAGWGGAPTCD